MEGNRDQPFDPPPPTRRFVYRTADPDTDPAHPQRRATDMPRPFLASSAQPNPRIHFLKFRVYLKVN